MSEETKELEWKDKVTTLHIVSTIMFDWEHVDTYLQFAIFQKFGFLLANYRYVADDVDNTVVVATVFANETTPEKLVDLETFLSNISWLKYEMIDS